MNGNTSIKQLIYSLLFIVLLSSTSCTLSVPYVSVLLGNYSFTQGEYQESLGHYMKALENKQYASWVQYNLANVYYSLGDLDAALTLWEESLSSNSTSLLFAIYYNMGILLYEQGEYEDSFENFKMALMNEPSHVETKINLELALLKWQSNRNRGVERQNQSIQNKELSENEIQLFEYIREQEEQMWRQRSQNKLVPVYVEDW